MTKSKLPSMGLKNFSGLSNQETVVEQVQPPKSIPKITEPSGKKDIQVANINIKIQKGQKAWLTEKANQVRENNEHPVQATERVFPQHLVCVAIDLLRSTDIDWSEIKSEQDLRTYLNL